MGEICLSVEIGPFTFDISFQVLDISASYNMLLGRPWIHMAGAVPSTLHQQVKFIVGGNLVTVSAKPDSPPDSLKEMPIISVDESVEPASYQAFEISTPQYRQLGAPALKPRVSPELVSVAREMLKMEFQPGQGLGKNGQGITKPIQLPTQTGKAGLGYYGGMRQKGQLKKVPTKIAGILIPRVSPERSPKISEPVSETGCESLIPTAEGSARREDFLQEVLQQFESKCYLPGPSSSSDKGKGVDVTPEAPQLLPVINWAGLTIPEGVIKEKGQGHVAVVIEEISEANPPFISRIPDDLTTANWTMEPVVSKKG